MFGTRDERVVMPDATLAEPAQSLGGGVLGAAMPEIGLLRAGIKNHKGRVLMILAGVAVLSVGLLLAISWFNGKDAQGGKRGADKFATALTHNSPSAAPTGDAQYVAGVRAYFGPVSSAKLIGGHERGVNAPNQADERTYYVAEMLIQSKRGPAGLELDFDDGAIGSDKISGVHELQPSDVSGLSAVQSEQLDAAFAARGGKAADVVKLTGTTPAAAPPSAVRVHSTPHVPVIPKQAGHQLNQATTELSCVQAAQGDVTKIQACTR